MRETIVETLLYRIGDAARVLGTSRRTVYRLVEEGSLPTVKLGRRGVRIHRAALERLAACGIEAPAGGARIRMRGGDR